MPHIPLVSKAYLIESNLPVKDLPRPFGIRTLENLDVPHWFINDGGHFPGSLFLDTTRERVWIFYSLLDASLSDVTVDSWINDIKGLRIIAGSRDHS